MLKVLFCILLNLVFFTLCQASETGDTSWTFDQTLPAPKKFSPAGPGGDSPNAFEKQFRKDTGETALTRRAEVDRMISLEAMSSKSHLRFDFDLSAWPEDLRSHARMWIAVGATNTMSADGTLTLTFSQSGAGMVTELNNTYNVDGTMVLGCDYAVTNGEVTVEIENRTHLAGINCSIHAIVYLPGKLDLSNLPKHP